MLTARLSLVAALLLPAAASDSRELKPITAAAVQPFAENDRVVFIGDSITHGGNYHGNVYLFYATRFPDRPFAAFNAGISGDTTPGTNQRFATDIARREPTVATIMLGMNDAWTWCFMDRGEELADWRLEGRDEAFDVYAKEMRELADSLSELGCRIIFIKPSIYDETALLKERTLIGKNALLGRFGAFLDQLAKEHGGEVIDFYTPMVELNARLQKDDPTATVIGRDRVHPEGPGHLVMSYEFLKAQGMPATVSAIDIEAAAGRVQQQENCVLESGARLTPTRVAFDCTESALPFPIASDQLEALQWVPFQQELNQQTIRIGGLEPGSYRMEIDGRLVGIYSAKQLAEGINQSNNTATPQHKQAVRVASHDAQRRRVVKRLRAVMHVRHSMIAKLNPPVSEDDREALRAALRTHIQQFKDKPWYEYLESQVEAYLAAAPQEARLERQAEEHRQAMWTANQPESHRWVIEPVTD